MPLSAWRSDVFSSDLAADAQVQRLLHRRVGQPVRPELAAQRQPQRVGATAGDVGLVAGDAEARAHGAGVALAAGAVVVAHLDGTREPAPGDRKSTRLNSSH